MSPLPCLEILLAVLPTVEHSGWERCLLCCVVLMFFSQHAGTADAALNFLPTSATGRAANREVHEDDRARQAGGLVLFQRGGAAQ